MSPLFAAFFLLISTAEAHQRPPDQCQVGERRLCPVQISTKPGGAKLAMRCLPDWQGVLRFNAADCNTPLVIAFDDAPVRFTPAAGTFALGGASRTEWVSASTPWLVLDRDGSGCVEGESELFGPRADRDAFASLAAYDADHDGILDERDPIFSRLALWYDRDQDRRCSPDEMVGLAKAGVVAIELSPTRTPSVTVGSYEGAWASMVFRTSTGAVRRGRVIDVFLAPM